MLHEESGLRLDEIFLTMTGVIAVIRDHFPVSLIVFYRLCDSVVTEGLSVLQQFSFKKVGLGEALLELFLI